MTRKTLDKQFLNKLIHMMTDDRFGPKDALGWPLLLDEVVMITDTEALKMSELHFELKQLVNQMDKHPLIATINTKLRCDHEMKL